MNTGEKIALTETLYPARHEETRAQDGAKRGGYSDCMVGYSDGMSDTEHTRPSATTRATEEEDARVAARPDKPPTEEEEAAADRAGPEDPEAARAYKEAIERGAAQKGEGQLP